MPILVDITDTARFAALLQKLTPETKPIWGKMTAQQMVEHMIDQVEYTNGRKIPTLDVSPQKAAEGKAQWIFTDLEIPRGIVIASPPDEYRYPDLQTAVRQLIAEIDTFHAYYKTPGLTQIHGGFGPLSYREWINWHGKHFTHHFKQFGLVG